MRFSRLFPVMFMLAAFSAHAEVPLTESDILGRWTVDKESAHRDGSNAKKLETVWTFNSDGTMVGESEDSQRHARVGKFRATLKYRIENGKLIKQSSPGRSKEETCVAEEKEGPKMLLKCKNVYFFMTKQ